MSFQTWEPSSARCVLRDTNLTIICADRRFSVHINRVPIRYPVRLAAEMHQHSLLAVAEIRSTRRTSRKLCAERRGDFVTRHETFRELYVKARYKLVVHLLS